MFGLFKKGGKDKASKAPPAPPGPGGGGGSMVMGSSRDLMLSSEPLPPEEELNKIFEEFLEDMAMPEAAKAAMRHQPPASKWQMVLLQRQNKQKAEESQDAGPIMIINSVRADPEGNIVKLRTAIASAQKTWLSAFVAQGGLAAIQIVVKKCTERVNKHDEIFTDCATTLRKLMDNPFGLSVVAQNLSLISSITAMMVTENKAALRQIVELLITLCCLRTVEAHDARTHESVLSAFHTYFVEHKEDCRFQRLMQLLDSSDEDWALKSRVITFINQLVDAEEIESRVSVRSDLLFLGIERILQDLKHRAMQVKTDPEQASHVEDCNVLIQQGEFFLKYMHHDLEDSMLGVISLSDPQSVFSAVWSAALQHGQQPILLSVLHHLLLIPGDIPLGASVWRQVDTMLHALVMGNHPAMEKISFSDIGFIHQLCDHVRELESNSKIREDTILTVPVDGWSSNPLLKAGIDEAVVKDLERRLAAAVESKDALQSQLADANTRITQLQTALSVSDANGQQALVRATQAEDGMRNLQARVAELQASLDAAKAAGASAPTTPSSHAALTPGAAQGVPRPDIGAAAAAAAAARARPDIGAAAAAAAAARGRPDIGAAAAAAAAARGRPDIGAAAAAAAAARGRPDIGAAAAAAAAARGRPDIGAAAAAAAAARGRGPAAADSGSAGPAAAAARGRPAGPPPPRSIPRGMPPGPRTRGMPAGAVPRGAAAAVYGGGAAAAAASAPAAPAPAAMPMVAAAPRRPVVIPRGMPAGKLLRGMPPNVIPRGSRPAGGAAPAAAPAAAAPAAPIGIAALAAAAAAARGGAPRGASAAAPRGLPSGAGAAPRGAGGGMPAAAAAAAAAAARGRGPAADAGGGVAAAAAAAAAARGAPAARGGAPRAPALARGPTAPGAGAGTGSEAKVEAAPSRPKKPVVKPLLPMKAFFWNKLDDKKIPGTIWDEFPVEDVPFDSKRLEAEFNKGQSGGASSTTSAAATTAVKKTGPILLLDPKRQQNVGIALARFKIPPKAMKKAILSVDPDVLTPDRVNTLLTMIPDAQEETRLREFDGDANNLGNVEQFFMALLEIPLLEKRLQAIKFRQTFPEKLQELSDRVDTVVKAMQVLKTSAAWKYLLRFVLAVGNYLNGGTSRGQAWGVRLDVLSMLDTTKASTGNHTLVMFIAREALTERGRALTNLRDEMEAIGGAKQVPITALEGDVKALTAGLSVVSDCVDQIQADPNSDDKFHEVFAPFLSDSQAKLSAIERRYTELGSLTKELAKYVGESARLDLDQFFDNLWSFVNQFADALGAARDEHEAALKAAAPSRAQQAAALAAAAAAAASGGDGGDNGLVENTNRMLRQMTADQALANTRGAMARKQSTAVRLDLSELRAKLPQRR